MIAVAMVALLQESHRDAPVLSVTELDHDVGRLIYTVGTPIVADTYTNLTGSGDLALIRSQELKNALSSFYARSDTVQVVSNTLELQLVNYRLICSTHWVARSSGLAPLMHCWIGSWRNPDCP